MDIVEKEQHVFNEISGIVQRSYTEYKLTYAQILGILDMIHFDLMCANNEQAEED